MPELNDIGLKRHTVRLANHSPAWGSLYAAEAALLRQLAGELVLDVQHVGSTSVPGLPAKPILDIAAALLTRDDIEPLVSILCANGYIDRGDGGEQGGYLLVKESQRDVRIVHLHLVEQTDRQWVNYLAFRDTLRADAAARDRYASLKQQLARQFTHDRRAYTDGKHEFIREVLRSPRK
ncbi:MAG: GrpB family protein [Armatimonadia bacterium]